MVFIEHKVNIFDLWGIGKWEVVVGESGQAAFGRIDEKAAVSI